LSVKIRLRRVGAKKQPSYRVVVADSHSPRDGRFIEIIGFYNPRTKPTTIQIDADKARKWLGNGAQPTESVASLLYRAGIADLRAPRWRKEGDVLPPLATSTTPTSARTTITATPTTPVEVAAPAPAEPAAPTPTEAVASAATIEAAAPAAQAGIDVTAPSTVAEDVPVAPETVVDADTTPAS
jgi:small subunit ribosomal protein S16